MLLSMGANIFCIKTSLWILAAIALKIISWEDNPLRRGKDAPDLFLIMRTYLDAGNRDRFFDENADLIGDEGFDYTLAGSRLLGRDIATILSSKTRKVIVDILDRETKDQDQFTIVENMIGRGTESSTFEEALRLLEEMKTGILERV